MVQIHHEQHAQRERETEKILMMMVSIVQIHDQQYAQRERERERERENGKRKALQEQKL